VASLYTFGLERRAGKARQELQQLGVQETDLRNTIKRLQIDTAKAVKEKNRAEEDARTAVSKKIEVEKELGQAEVEIHRGDEQRKASAEAASGGPSPGKPTRR
jgi:septal ring factor EnvC (AmiA/AmiB activator)